MQQGHKNNEIISESEKDFYTEVYKNVIFFGGVTQLPFEAYLKPDYGCLGKVVINYYVQKQYTKEFESRIDNIKKLTDLADKEILNINLKIEEVEKEIAKHVEQERMNGSEEEIRAEKIKKHEKQQTQLNKALSSAKKKLDQNKKNQLLISAKFEMVQLLSSMLNFYSDSIISKFSKRYRHQCFSEQTCDEEQVTQLHKTIEKETFEVLKKQLSAIEINLNEREKDSKETAIHVAIRRRDVSILSELVSRGADVNLLNKEGVLPLCLAIQNYKEKRKNKDYKKIIDCLLNAQTLRIETWRSDQGSPFHTAAAVDDIDTLKKLIEKLNLNNDYYHKNSILCSFNYLGQTILHTAICNSSIRVFKYLIDEKVIDIEIADANGYPALLYSAMLGKVDSFCYLMRAGANVDYCIFSQGVLELLAEIEDSNNKEAIKNSYIQYKMDKMKIAFDKNLFTVKKDSKLNWMWSWRGDQVDQRISLLKEHFKSFLEGQDLKKIFSDPKFNKVYLVSDLEELASNMAKQVREIFLNDNKSKTIKKEKFHDFLLGELKKEIEKTKVEVKANLDTNEGIFSANEEQFGSNLFYLFFEAYALSKNLLEEKIFQDEKNKWSEYCKEMLKKGSLFGLLALDLAESSSLFSSLLLSLPGARTLMKVGTIVVSESVSFLGVSIIDYIESWSVRAKKKAHQQLASFLGKEKGKIFDLDKISYLVAFITYRYKSQINKLTEKGGLELLSQCIAQRIITYILSGLHEPTNELDLSNIEILEKIVIDALRVQTASDKYGNNAIIKNSINDTSPWLAGEMIEQTGAKIGNAHYVRKKTDTRKYGYYNASESEEAFFEAGINGWSQEQQATSGQKRKAEIESEPERNSKKPRQGEDQFEPESKQFCLFINQYRTREKRLNDSFKALIDELLKAFEGKMNKGEIEMPSILRDSFGNEYEIQDVKGDGNCFYRAVANAMFGNEARYDEIRAKCVDEMVTHQEDYRKCVRSLNEAVDNTVEEGTWLDGDFVIQAAARAFNVRIKLISDQNGCSHDYLPRKDGNSQISLGYVGGCHYVALIKKELQKKSRLL